MCLFKSSHLSISVTVVTVQCDQRRATLKVPSCRVDSGLNVFTHPHGSTAACDCNHRLIPPWILTLVLERHESAYFTWEIDFIMAYVITDTCIKDSLCVEVCPTDCIHPKQEEEGFAAATQMYVDAEGCIDCGACIPACTSDSIHALEDVPEDKKEFVEKNAAFYKR